MVAVGCEGAGIATQIRSILVIDDDERIVNALARTLGRHREVHAASHPAAAFDVVRRVHPDLVILDLWLGSISGLDVIRTIKTEAPGTIVMLISGYLSTDVIVSAVRAGADHVVAKPVSGTELLRRIDGALVDVGVKETPSLARAEAEHITRVMGDCSGNISETARRLGIHRSSLQRKLRRLTPDQVA